MRDRPTEGGGNIPTMDSDVIVVGAGLAGLVVGYELAAADRSVIMLDSEPLESIGGQAYWSFGGLFMVNSSEQRRLRIHDSEELALADWLGSAAFDRGEDYWPRRWAEAYVNFAAGEQRSWLHGLGVRWFPLVQWAERGGYATPGHGNSVPRFHVTWGTGPGLLEPFAGSVMRSRRVRIRCRHQVTSLEVDDSGVRVSGQILEPTDVPRGVQTSRGSVGEFSYLRPGRSGGERRDRRELRPRPAELASELGLAAATHDRRGAGLRRRIRAEDHRSRRWTGDQPRPDVALSRGDPQPLPDLEPPRHPDPGRTILVVAGCPRRTVSGPTVSRLRRAGCAATCRRQRLRLLLVRARSSDAGSGDRALWIGAERRPDRQGPAAAGRSDAARSDARGAGVPGARRGLPRRRIGPELAAQMNQLVGEHLVDGESLRRVIEARDLQVRSGLGKDPQVVATAAARRFIGDRLMRVVAPHELLDPKDPGAGRAGSGGPLVAVRLHVLTRKTLGGLETDLDGRVLRPDGAALRGCTRWVRRPGSAAAACTATEPSKAHFWAAACSPAGTGRALAASL